ncbi:MAG: ERCC4 domain-containing protein [Pseudomonadota bacterium]
MKLKIDSREKLPYQFNCPSETGTLSTGDYSVSGLENHISIERKELNDLIGCLSKGRDRFERELFRGKSLDYFCLIVEADLKDIVNHAYRSKMLPRAVLQSLMAFSIRYRMPIFFCGDRATGQLITESLLIKYCREQEKTLKAIAL